LHSIDRIDNDGNYEPTNTRWVLNPVQGRNKRSNNNITAFGTTRCVTDWAKDLGAAPSAIARRITVGWTPEDAVSRPPQQQQLHMLTIRGETLSAMGWARRTGVALSTLLHRLSEGWTADDAVFAPPGIHGVGRKATPLTVGTETLEIGEWARRLGVSPNTIRQRLAHGWPLEAVVGIPSGVSTGGELNGNSKLTHAHVVEIKRRLASESASSLGREFGVSKQTILGIKNGKTWK
jgi:hypothetical protein